MKGALARPLCVDHETSSNDAIKPKAAFMFRTAGSSSIWRVINLFVYLEWLVAETGGFLATASSVRTTRDSLLPQACMLRYQLNPEPSQLHACTEARAVVVVVLARAALLFLSHQLQNEASRRNHAMLVRSFAHRHHRIVKQLHACIGQDARKSLLLPPSTTFEA